MGMWMLIALGSGVWLYEVSDRGVVRCQYDGGVSGGGWR